jgi:hypothetical protein
MVLHNLFCFRRYDPSVKELLSLLGPDAFPASASDAETLSLGMQPATAPPGHPNQYTSLRGPELLADLRDLGLQTTLHRRAILDAARSIQASATSLQALPAADLNGPKLRADIVRRSHNLLRLLDEATTGAGSIIAHAPPPAHGKSAGVAHARDPSSAAKKLEGATRVDAMLAAITNPIPGAGAPQHKGGTTTGPKVPPPIPASDDDSDASDDEGPPDPDAEFYEALRSIAWMPVKAAPELPYLPWPAHLAAGVEMPPVMPPSRVRPPEAQVRTFLT